MIASLKTVHFPNPDATLNALIEEMGPLHVLTAASRALLRRNRRARPLPADTLSNYLRKDVGLEPSHRPPEFRGPIF